MDNVFWSSFMEGFTGGGMLSPPEQPGAATQVFAEPPVEDESGAVSRDVVLASAGRTSSFADPVIEALRPEIGDKGVEAVAETIRRYREKTAHGAHN